MEALLVEKVRTQDSSVIGQLYDNYGSALYGVVLRIVGSNELAEQVVQDTFVKIWKNGPNYDPAKGRLFTWMLNIARNTAIDTIRSAGFKNQRMTVEVDKTLYATPGESVNHDHMDIKAIVEKLDDKYKILVQKIYFEGYTQQELSDEFDMPIGTIKTRLRYAMNELRGLMGGSSAEIMTLLYFISKTN